MIAKGLVIVAVLAIGFLMSGCGCTSCGTNYASSEGYVAPSQTAPCNFVEERNVNSQDFQTNVAYWDCSGS